MANQKTKEDALETKPSIDLRLQAAALGPGFRGTKSGLDAAARAEEAKRIAGEWRGEPPKFLAEVAEGREPTWVERKAKLFEVGEYADKGVNVAEADLARLAEAFAAPAPVWIEHSESPLEMGYLTDVRAVGGELFGILSLTQEADSLLERSGAKSLSLSVSKDFDEIYEVSIVGKPRVQSARLFCEDFTATESGAWKREALDLRHRLRETRFSTMLDDLTKSGKLAPAQRASALELLRKAGDMGIEDAVTEFLHAAPVRVVFGEIAKETLSQPDLSSEETAFYSRHFPNLDLAEIAKRRS